MIEVIKQMVDALEWCHGGEPVGTADAIKAGKQAIKELESQAQNWDALAEKQLASIKRDTKATTEDAVVRAAHKVMAELESQEPVAWMDADGNVSDNDDHKCFPTPLYTASPQRTWVGLTGEDRYEFAAAQYSWEELLIAAEAKLKEKNT